LRSGERVAHGHDFVDWHIDGIVGEGAGLDAGVVQHLVDQPEQVPLAAADARQVFPLRLGQRSVHPQLQQF
jgi:hypothetical protein